MSDLRGELQAIYEHHGKLTPRLVVDEAREEDHPLHDRFEWNNEIAGEAWRRDQAHRLIQSVRIVYKPANEREGEKSVRAFHAVRKENGHVYEPTEKVTADPFIAQLVLRDMEREWRQLKQRYDQFEEFWDMVRQDAA